MFILDLETSCTSQTLASILGITRHILILISIVVPILLIISLLKSFTTLMQNPDEKGGVKKIINSLLAAMIVFFIPTILNILMNVLGERYNLSSCWLLAKIDRKALNSTKYINIGNQEKKPILPDPEKYEEGNPEDSTSFASNLSSDYREKLIAAAKSQLGVPYYTMNYGPKELGSTGFGCAMFVSYCYNQVFFNGVRGDDWNTSGFYGSTYEYWGNVTTDGYNPHNKKFVEVSAAEALPGDVVAYTSGSNPYSSYSTCGHVALYTGNGRIIGSWGLGTSGPGIIEGDVESQAVGRDPHFLRYVGS